MGCGSSSAASSPPVATFQHSDSTTSVASVAARGDFSVKGDSYFWTETNVPGFAWGLQTGTSCGHYCVKKETQVQHVGIKIPRDRSAYDYEKELSILTQLASVEQHENLLRINGFEEGEELAVILTCEMSGGDLFEAVVAGKLSELGAPKCLRLCSQLLAGVAHLHTLKFIHRDVKPENILLSCADVSEAKLCLSNFSCTVSSTDGQLMHRATGTPSYVAPEVISKQGYYSQADCWSVGVTFFTMIAADDPWGGGSEDEIFPKIQKCEWNKNLFKKGVGVTDEVVAFIDSLLCLDPRVRARAANAMQRARQLWYQFDSAAASAELDENNPDMSLEVIQYDQKMKDNSTAPKSTGQTGQTGMQFPEYWRNRNQTTKFCARREMCLPAFVEQLKVLLDQTFKNKATRDRKGALPKGLRLVEAHRVEDSPLWNRYAVAREALRTKRGSVTRFHDLDGDHNEETGQLRTDNALGDFSCRLDPSINECYLFHGTSPEAAESISETGFSISKAGSSVGTMFGKGAYFAEASSKADEYSQRGAGIYATSLAMLVCRVVCGEMFRMTKADDGALDKALASNQYDSVLGDREASVGTYREFVMFDADLIYPEYVVIYEHA